MTHVSALNCPSCGGPVELASRFVRTVVCAYCGSTLAVEDDRLDPTGKTAKLAQTPTRFFLGARCTLRGRHCQILGRVRFADDESCWDEWYLQFDDGGAAWLEEEEGEYILSHKQALTGAVPGFDQVRVGQTLSINGQPFFVTERCRARIAGAEGQLFYRAVPGRPVLFVDGNLGGRVASIEYGEDEIELTVGEPIGRSEITVEGA